MRPARAFFLCLGHAQVSSLHALQALQHVFRDVLRTPLVKTSAA